MRVITTSIRIIFLIALITTLIVFAAEAQDTDTTRIVENNFERLENITTKSTFNTRLEKVTNYTYRPQRHPKRYTRTMHAAVGSDTSRQTYVVVKKLAVSLTQKLIEAETPTEYEAGISAHTRALINLSDNSYNLSLIQRELIEMPDTEISDWMRDKLLKGIGERMTALDRMKYSMYAFPSDDKQVAKFISVRTGNDLFTMAGIASFFMPADKFIKDGNIFFQRNDDRDYTGSLLVEIGTDYLNLRGANPSKSYQAFLYGFDVYTPYFRSDAIFPADTSFNKLDRPHASFQYFGWSKKGLSYNDIIRWTVTARFGKIGGNAGSIFQDVLHKDISHSPKPRGWAAQIANGGRVGFSIDYKIERQFPLAWKIYPSLAFDAKVGTFMTTGGLALQLSNRSFQESNPNFFIRRTRRKALDGWHAFKQWTTISASLTGNGVLHDTMLEGYGILKTKEGEYDKLERKSKYYLSRDQVKRLTAVANITLSYTGRFITYFYNWKSFSPVTNQGDIGIPSPYSVQKGEPKNMNISGRWHHFAELGVVFTMQK